MSTPDALPPLDPTESGMLAAICEHPGEDTPRLALADWYEETGEPTLVARARHIRGQIEIASGEPPDPNLASDCQRLLWRHGRGWAVRLGLPTAHSNCWEIPEQWDRGFPYILRLPSVAAWRRACRAGLFRRAPIASCQVRGREPHEVGTYSWAPYPDNGRPPWSAGLPQSVYDIAITDPGFEDGWWPSRESARAAAWSAFAAVGRKSEFEGK